MPIQLQKKDEIISDFACHPKDCGSTSVQIALLTVKITNLQKHFLTHKKDRHSRRGLLKMVSKRRSLLNYLESQNKDGYIRLIKKLGIRR